MTAASPDVSPRDRIIVALDLPSVAVADKLVWQLGDSITFYKIGYQLGYAGGLSFAQDLIKSGKKVFFDLKLLAADPHVNDVELAYLGARKVGLDTLLAESDFVVAIVLLNEKTRKLIGAREFARMKKDAYFINVSRGNLVDESALENALKKGIIAGAAMDVGRAADQMPTPSLAALPNVIATPHTGRLTPPAAFHQSMETVRQVAEILKGKTPVGAVNAEVASRLSLLVR